MVVIDSCNMYCAACKLKVNADGKTRAHEEIILHRDCLRCKGCSKPLQNNKWCFLHRGLPYCDISCLQGKRLPKDSCCFKCGGLFHGNSNVIQLRRRIYHIHCLSCGACGNQMKPGFRYAVENNIIICYKHIERAARRTQITDMQRCGLLYHYKRCKYPNIIHLENMAKKLKLPMGVIKIWFQNYRARNKRHYRS